MQSLRSPLDAQSTCTCEYNFPDGDVSLLVEQTSFRVHRDKLVSHSHVFGDMFVVAHPDDVEDEEESRAISVRMPDKAEEWGLVFSVLYPSKDRATTSKIASLRDIAVGLRMAEKYDVADVHAWAVAHFNHRYPASLVYISPTDTLLETASFALNLARMYDLHSVVPSICFALATSPTGWLLTLDELKEILERWLDPDDVERVVAGRNILWKRTLIARYEAEATQSVMLAPYCAVPGPSGHITNGYARAAKSCRDILAERLSEALGMTKMTPQTRTYPLPGGYTWAGRRMSTSGGFKGSKQGSGRHFLDALQILEEMDDMDLAIWPSSVCHICSLVHSRWVAQTKARVTRNILETFE